MTDNNAKSLQELQNDLATFIRVRNRLAQTPDEQLPNVLQALLPRILRRLDENSIVLYSAPPNELSIRQQMETQLVGILSHTLERVRGRREMPVPWITSVLQVLNTIESTVTLTLTLSLLQRALPRYPQPSNTIEHWIPCLDTLYHQMRTNVTEARKPQFYMIGWIFLDAIALSFGLPALVDRDIDHYGDGVSWQDLDSKTVVATELAIQAMSNNGTGVLDLLLDILLFWPPPARRTRTGNETDNTTGLSIEGLARMNHRGSSWTEVYLRQLKYACTRYAIMPPQQGLLRGDRSLILAVLSSSGSSMHGRIAAANLSQYDKSTSLVRNKNGQWQGYQACCSLQLASCLLILVLGDEAAKPVLEQHDNNHHQWETILGPRPTESSMYRSPLPVSVAARAIDFIRCHCRPDAKDIAGGNASVRLFVDLVVAVQDPLRHGVYWGIQLIEGLYKQLRQSESSDGWVDGFYRRCLRTAKAVLSTVPDSMPTETTPRRDQPLGLPGGVPEPFNRRADLNNLLNKHRSAQKRKLLKLDRAVHAREIAYEMISELSSQYQLEDDPDGMQFELPIEVFKCIGSEEEGLQQSATRALDVLLVSCKRRSDQRRRDDERTRRYRVAVLLPSLLCAACTENAVARLAVAKWCNEFLATMDPSAASHICAYLCEDLDPFVSALAKKTMSSLHVASALDHMETEYQAEFMDLKNPSEVDIIRDDLETRISTLAREGRMSDGAAFLLLQGHQYSKEEVFKGLLCDRAGTLERCGLTARIDGPTDAVVGKDVEDFTCGICYDEFENYTHGYAMPCAHRFCHACWKAYLSSSLESEIAVLRLTCPHHECTERVSNDEFLALVPELIHKWNDACLKSYIQDSEYYQTCTGPDCEVVAHLPAQRSSQTVTCRQCQKSFCFECGDQPHQPAKCRDFEEWNRIFGSSEFWVKKNAKPCPSCRAPIEKNQGCNHIKCTQCGADFCWLCLTPLRLHLEVHTCNRYDPIAAAGDDEERRALFFTERYQAHDEAEMFAKDQLKEIEKNLDKLASKTRFVAEEEWDILSNALKTLIRARYFLKYSYIAAWAIRNDAEKRDVFENHQATLEVVSERLSQMTMMKLEDLFTGQGPRGVRMHFRAMTFNASSISSYMQRIAYLQKA